MGKESKREFLDCGIVCCLFLAVACFPFSKIFASNDHALLASTIAHFSFAAGLIVFYAFKKKGLRAHLKTGSVRWFLLFLPGIALSASNVIWLYAFGEPNRDPTLQRLLCYAFYALSVALSEEIVFRYGLLGTFLECMKRQEFAILFSALIFGLSHLLSLDFVSSPGMAFAQAGYTFFLGLLWGAAYAKKAGIVFPIVFHFLFNFLNDGLFTALYAGEWDISFVVFNIAFGGVVLLYVALLWLIEEKKIRKIKQSAEEKEDAPELGGGEPRDQ